MSSSIPAAMRAAFRKYVTDGVPGSGLHNPDKTEIAGVGATIGAELDTLTAGLAVVQAGQAAGVIGYATKAAMDADLAHAAGAIGRVMADPTPSNNGDYLKTGASGAGAWVAKYDSSKVIHVLPSAGSGGDGSVASPYNGTDAIAAVNADTTRNKLEIILKAGVMRIPPFRFDPVRWREVTIRAALGMNADIYCSEAIASGSAAWTRPDAAGNPNVWMTAHKWNTTLNSTTPSGGLIHLNTASSCGRTGVYQSPSTIYTNLGQDIALATINNIAYRGSYSIQTIGTYAGKILVHALADADPNTITFERSIYDFGIWAPAALGTDFNGLRVNLSGIRTLYSASGGIWLDRCAVDVENCASLLNLNYGFQFNQSDGIVAECVASYNGSDGFNGNGHIADNSHPNHKNMLTLIGCKSLGCQQMLLPPVILKQVGDGFSNHNDQIWHLIDCTALGATKDGGSMIDDCKFTNFFAEDCTDTGIKLASVTGTAIEASVFGGRIKGCNTGMMSTSGTGFPAGSTAVLHAQRVTFDTNFDRDMHATGDQSCIINARDCSYIGATPATARKVADTSGVINIITSTSADSPVPVTKGGTTSTQGEDESELIFNASGTHTATLLSAASHPGRVINVKNISAQTINSASSNVVPLAGGAAATALLSNTAGKWAKLKSDGTNWVIMQAG